MSAYRSDEPAHGLRLDRWLWCARFFKTRSVAVEAIRAGHVRVNGQRVKPAREIKIGDALLINRDDVEYEVAVAALPARRGPAAEARLCYIESDASVELRRVAAERRALDREAGRPPTPGRPDKRTRRLMRAKRQ